MINLHLIVLDINLKVIDYLFISPFSVLCSSV